MTKIFLKTYGCQMNEYDSSRLLDLLKSHGITPASTPEEATILLLNTCSIRERAHEKVFSELGRWRELKQQNPEIIIGVTGCVASQEGHAIQKRAPYVDFVLGPQTIHKLPEILDQLKITRTHLVDISFPEIEKFNHLPPPSSNGPSAYVAIMEGCNNFCSYCIVPYTRGKEISRPVADVLAEITTLSQQAVNEITLLGQCVNAYRGTSANGKITDLAALITDIAKIDGIERIHFMTSQPREFTDNLTQIFKIVKKLANHIHLPVQSGSNRILKLMNRGYTIEEFHKTIGELRKVRPNISISTDFIVGFPGETEADFAETLNLIKAADLDQSFSFIYSKRPGTAAANYPDDVSFATKKQRLLTLQAVIQEHAKIVTQRMVGTTQTVLVAGISKKNTDVYFGKTENNKPVHFTAANLPIGKIVPVYITKAIINNLYGELQ